MGLLLMFIAGSGVGFALGYFLMASRVINAALAEGVRFGVLKLRETIKEVGPRYAGLTEEQITRLFNEIDNYARSKIAEIEFAESRKQ